MRTCTAKACRARQRRTLATIGQLVSWEIDLFGRVGTALAAAERQVDAAEADARGATALLQAEGWRQYVQLRHHQQTQLRLDEELEVSQQRLDRVKARVAAGLVDRREGLAIEAEREQLQAERSQVVAAAHIATSALAVLVGRSPTQTDAAWQALIAPADLPRLPADVAIVAPTDLLANRPDVARADALWRASRGNVVLAERAHLPRLSLAASFGLKACSGRPWPGRRRAVRRRSDAAMGLAGLRPRAGPRRRRTGRQRSRLAWPGEHRAQGPQRQRIGAARLGRGARRRAAFAAGRTGGRCRGRLRRGTGPCRAGAQRRRARTARRLLAGAAGGRSELRPARWRAFAQVQLALAAWQPEAGVVR